MDKLRKLAIGVAVAYGLYWYLREETLEEIGSRIDGLVTKRQRLTEEIMEAEGKESIMLRDTGA